ncbi:MAG: AAA family ATPase, partial [Microbispora sp.]|nr:AAA family ATPase [Microbispora sp.]
MGLVERDEEMAALKALLAGAVLGQGKIALVGGGVATGKSELLHAFAEQAIEQGALAITATGSRMERDLAFGVVGQLIHDAPLTAGDRERALALLHEGVRGTASPGIRPGTHRQVDPHVVHGLCMILLELSERCPLVIAVDDVHHADHASLLCLSHLCRRVRLARIMAVFGHSGQAWHGGAFIHELLRRPYCHRFRLAPLSRDGVVSMVRQRVGRAAAERFAEEWDTLSGGNPLLAAALAEDHRESVRSGRGERRVVPGDRYAQAVLSCLHRGEPRTLRVARGLAVLGGPDLLARLLGIGPADVARELHALTDAGLLSDGRFRHEAARAAVLADMDAEERAGLHGRAAEAAHDAGAAPAVIAAHLLEAGRADAPWAVPVLEEAARAALRAGRADAAVAQLTLARRACRDEPRRARITASLLRAQWRIDPGATPALLAELAEAERRGALRGGDAVALARALLWHGRAEDARAVLGRLGEGAVCAAGCDCGTAGELSATQLWLRVTHPPLHTPPGFGARLSRK